jgi:glutaconate CoA-transferase subunit B
MSACTRDEWMTVAAARLLGNDSVCFVGIGLPSAACNLARLTHAPEIVLIYESGTIGTRPDVLPLSIGDGELAETAACVVPLPEIFSFYLQAGRVDVGFLGAAQIDRFGNLNSTVIGCTGPADALAGAGGAEIAPMPVTFIVMKASPRSRRAARRAPAGFDGGDACSQRRAAGPRAVITI